MSKEIEKPIHAKPSLYAFYFDVIKEIGKEYGYNIVLHGSMNRDLDLIAIPWQESIGDKKEMLERIANAMGGYVMFETDEQRAEFRTKFNGRECWIININRTIKAKVQGMITEFEEYADPQYYIDLSILPLEQSQEDKNRISELESTVKSYGDIANKYSHSVERIKKLEDELNNTRDLYSQSENQRVKLESKISEQFDYIQELKEDLRSEIEKYKNALTIFKKHII